MLSRRRFIESGLAGSIVGSAAGSIAWDATGPVVRGGANAAAARTRLYAVLYEQRFAEAVRFGRAAERCSLPARAVRADVTRIWYEELDPLWRRQPQPIAGLTAYAALFCLERLAWTHGMRVVHHGTHPRLDPADSHPRPDPADWTRYLARRLAGLERESVWRRLPPIAVTAASTTSGAAGHGQPLHFWVIAPVARELERT